MFNSFIGCARFFRFLLLLSYCESCSDSTNQETAVANALDDVKTYLRPQIITGNINENIKKK